MRRLANDRIAIVLGLIASLSLPVAASSQTPAAAAADPAKALPDGQHDFDFNIGVWHTHIRRILDPFSGATKTMELNGTVTVRKVWGGRAQLEEIEAEGPKGHWEGLTLFLYNPEAHQWSQNYVDSKTGVFGTATVGSFKDGRGELFAQDTFNDRAVLLRGVWSDIKPDSHRYAEYYSSDGGRTWAPVFIADLTREKQ